MSEDMQAIIAAAVAEAVAAATAKPAESGKAATEAKMGAIKRNLDPVSVPLTDDLRAEVSPVSRRGDMLTAPRVFVIAGSEKGKDRSVNSLNAAQFEALCAGSAKVEKALATVKGRAFPEAG